MVKLIILLILVFFAPTLQAQLVIMPGASVHLAGNATLTLRDVSLGNNGNFDADSGSTVVFNGSALSTIYGTQPLHFYHLTLAKDVADTLQLTRDINVRGSLIFTSGLLNISHHTLDLMATGELINERESSRITSTGSGHVAILGRQTPAVGFQPGNIGAFVLSGHDLGRVTVRRYHVPNIPGPGFVRRLYQVETENAGSFNAYLRLRYLDVERTADGEDQMQIHYGSNVFSFAPLGTAARDTSSDWIATNSFTQSGVFAIGAINSALPVRFTSLQLSCLDGKAVVRWQTAQEWNSERFVVEFSTNGAGWQEVGSVAAAGNSNTPRSYSFTHAAVVAGAYYRVVEYSV